MFMPLFNKQKLLFISSFLCCIFWEIQKFLHYGMLLKHLLQLSRACDPIKYFQNKKTGKKNHSDEL